MSFEDGLRLVKLRGESMQAAADAAKSGMVSVIGLNKEKVAELCEAATKEVRQQQQQQQQVMSACAGPSPSHVSPAQGRNYAYCICWWLCCCLWLRCQLHSYCKPCAGNIVTNI
jgi:hypothetical protein